MQRVVVVGGGVVGVSTALFVALEAKQLGTSVEVTVLERRGAVAAEASGLNAGLVSLGGQPGSLDRLLSFGSLALYRQLHEMQSLHNEDTEYRECGALYACHTAAHALKAAKEVEETKQQIPLTPTDREDAAFIDKALQLLRGAGGTNRLPGRFTVEAFQLPGSELFTPDTASSRFGVPFGNKLKGVLHHANSSADANPQATVRALAALARQNGVCINLSSRFVSAHGTSDGVWHVQYTGSNGVREITAESLAICAGYSSGSISTGLRARTKSGARTRALPLPVFPVQGQMWAVQGVVGDGGVPAEHVFSMDSYTCWDEQMENSAQQPAHFVPGVTHLNTSITSSPPPAPVSRSHYPQSVGHRQCSHLYARVTASGEFICGGDRVPGCMGAPVERGLAENRAHAEAILPGVVGRKETRRWFGYMPWTPDKKPIIGRVPWITEAGEVCTDPGLPGLHTGTGFCSSGFCKGAFAGFLVAQSILHDSVPNSVRKDNAHPHIRRFQKAEPVPQARL